MISNATAENDTPFVGIIMLDTTFPRIKGDIGNPDTFSFPVRLKIVKNASPERVVTRADISLLQHFIDAGQALIREGAAVITTSCGFLALFHQELVKAFDVPVFSSSLLQVHLAASVIKKDKKVGIITASKTSLTKRHMAAVGIDQYPLAIVGMDNAEEFSSVFIKGKKRIDPEKCRQEMEDAALILIRNHPDVGAVVLECTNMPPFADAVQKTIGGMPVFDVVTMVNYAYTAIHHTHY